ncbi:MAG: 16S rRNA (cytidine(1402)-2'-O)-methyltransferase [Spirochaetes bacterium]|nr:16S rRNA (cytidine(1402)-2'-O)-methyltransferase [Spirochaetota bacterium]
MAVLYIVATPIGNLKDITLRALDTLKNVDIIACEDTRQTLKLLNHYEIKKKLVSFHSHNEKKAGEKILRFLKEGSAVALVCDSGTPGISDPGASIVRLVRDRNIRTVPIPGPSAVSTLISVSGIESRGFCFYGFLSPKGSRRRKDLQRIKAMCENIVIYESPYRVKSLLEDMAAILPERKVFIGREITKIYEEFIFGRADEILTQLQVKDRIRGEFSILIEGTKKV